MTISGIVLGYPSKRTDVNQLKAKSIKRFLDHGYGIMERNCGNGHMVIIGGKRRVNFYPTTGTVHVDKQNNIPQIKTRGIENALKILKEGSL